MAGRRSNREGSVYRRASDGKWCASVTLPDGRRKVLYGRTREEASRKLTAALHAVQQGAPPRSDERLTVGAFLTKWLEESARPAVRPKTYAGYKLYVERHLVPGLGRLRLVALTPEQVQAFLNGRARAATGRATTASWAARRAEKGAAPLPADAGAVAHGPPLLAPRTVFHIRAVLRKALNQALVWGLVTRNAAALANPPRVPEEERRPLSPEEAKRFLAAVSGDRLEALYALALTVGLRQGELLGLRWQDVDLEAGTLRITQALQRVRDRDGTTAVRLVEPKTKRSKRTIALPALARDALRRRKARQAEERLSAGARWRGWHEAGPGKGLVFTTGLGTSLEASNVTHYFQRHLRRTGLPPRRFHDLRHSAATFLLASGTPPRVVMEILGHSHVALTMTLYGHVLQDQLKDAAGRMDALFAGAPSAGV